MWVPIRLKVRPEALPDGSPMWLLYLQHQGEAYPRGKETFQWEEKE
jgi:hypothetical protein